MRDFIRRRWPDVVLGVGVVVGVIWVAFFAAESTTVWCAGGGQCLSGFSVESEDLEPGRTYDSELCIDGYCLRMEMPVAYTRDVSSDATAVTTAPAGPGSIWFDLAPWDDREIGSVELRIWDQVSGELVVDFVGVVEFNITSVEPGCGSSCWHAHLNL